MNFLSSRARVVHERLSSFTVLDRTISNIRGYYSKMPNSLAFEASDISGFLVFGVPNAKNLAFSIPDANALKRKIQKILQNCYL